jgi:hypothetical protein
MSSLDPAYILARASAEEIALSNRILKKAEDLLAPLKREMDIMKWPPEYRAIIWAAVQQQALKLERQPR